MDRKRILMVDDHVDSLELMKIMLGDDYNVFTYASAAEALKVVQEVKPALLMLDVCMYPIDGIECLKAIRATDGNQSIPAIALTALARDVDKQALLAAGFQAVVTKPLLDQDALRSSLEELLKIPSQDDANFSGKHQRRELSDKRG
jgi:CheY-like chemotaxis protein